MKYYRVRQAGIAKPSFYLERWSWFRWIPIGYPKERKELGDEHIIGTALAEKSGVFQCLNYHMKKFPGKPCTIIPTNKAKLVFAGGVEAVSQRKVLAAME